MSNLVKQAQVQVNENVIYYLLSLTYASHLR